MPNPIEYLSLPMFKSDSSDRTPVLLHAEAMMKYWRANKGQYAGFDRDFYQNPVICWFRWETQTSTKKRLPGRAPLAIEVSKVSFDGVKLNFSNGRNRAHWFVGQNMNYVPATMRTINIPDAKLAGLISKVINRTKKVCVPCFNYDNAERCGDCNGNCY